MLTIISQKHCGIITRQDTLKIIELYCDTIHTYNLSEKQILHIIHKKQSDNAFYSTILQNFFQSEKNKEIDTKTKSLVFKYSKYIKCHFESVKDKIKIIIAFMLNSIKNNNNFEQLISYLYKDLKTLLLNSNGNYELKKILYHEIKIDINNRKLYFPINHCKTLYDIIFAYL